MRYYLELRINEYIKPDDLDMMIRKPLADRLGEIGNISIAIPEYQSYRSSKEELLELNFDGKILFFKYIKVYISLLNLSVGIDRIKKFLDDNNLDEASKLVFKDERYNLLEIEL